MHAQVEERTERLSSNGHGVPTQRCGALAVCSGSGMAALFEGLGVHALDGGATLNPSTYDLLAGIHDVAAEEVVVLPNRSNVFMAAERAAELSEKQVRVVHSTRNQQAGLAAAIALLTPHVWGHRRPPRRCSTRSSRCAPARSLRQRATTRRPLRAGDAVGFVGDELVAWGAPEATLRYVLADARRRRRAGDLSSPATAHRSTTPAIDALVPRRRRDRALRRRPAVVVVAAVR